MRTGAATTFSYPTSIIRDAKRPDYLLLTDSQRNSILQIHLTTRIITPFKQFRRKNNVRGMVQDPNTGDLFLSMKVDGGSRVRDKVVRLDYITGNQSNIAKPNRTSTQRSWFTFNTLVLIDNATKLVYLDDQDSKLTFHVSSNLYTDPTHCRFEYKNVTNLLGNTVEVGPSIQIAGDTLYYAFQTSNDANDRGHFRIEKLSPWRMHLNNLSKQSTTCPGNSARDFSVV